MTFSKNGQITDMNVKFFSTKRSKKIENAMQMIKENDSVTIKLHKSIVPKELMDENNHMERLIESSDRRILMCGKVLI